MTIIRVLDLCYDKFIGVFTQKQIEIFHNILHPNNKWVTQNYFKRERVL